jgi:hypothetical protein
MPKESSPMGIPAIIPVRRALGVPAVLAVAVQAAPAFKLGFVAVDLGAIGPRR